MKGYTFDSHYTQQSHSSSPLTSASASSYSETPETQNSIFEQYVQEISRFSLLSQQETEKLAVKLQEEGSVAERNILVSSNLRLVVKITLDYQFYWKQNFMDLVQEGNIGLIKAVSKFDPGRGIKFSYYATYWIRAYILKFLMNNWRLVKLGTTQAQRKLFFSLNKEKAALEALGYSPDPELLAQHFNVRESDITEMSIRLNNDEISLDAPVDQHNSKTERQHFIPADNVDIEANLQQQELQQRVQFFLKEVTPIQNEKEKIILEQRLLSEEPVTLQKISEYFGVSRERIRQIEKNLLRKFRKYIDEFDTDMHTLLSAG